MKLPSRLLTLVLDEMLERALKHALTLIENRIAELMEEWADQIMPPERAQQVKDLKRTANVLAAALGDNTPDLFREVAEVPPPPKTA